MFQVDSHKYIASNIWKYNRVHLMLSVTLATRMPSSRLLLNGNLRMFLDQQSLACVCAGLPARLVLQTRQHAAG